MEDDIRIKFKVDFNKLASTAPRDFSILQLFTSNSDFFFESWKNYKTHMLNVSSALGTIGKSDNGPLTEDVKLDSFWKLRSE
jgi:hypothetical protein